MNWHCVNIFQPLCFYSLCTATLFSTNRLVTTTADSGPNSLRQAIINTNAGASGDTITFTVSGTISLASPLPPVLQKNVTMDTNGNTITVNGGTSYSGLFIWPQSSASTFTLNNSTGGSFTATTASVGGGGNGGGGALGAGGGIFVGENNTVNIQGITFTNCLAKGGDASSGGAEWVPGSTINSAGGGGMSGGTGGSYTSLYYPKYTGVTSGPGGGGFASSGGNTNEHIGGAGGGGIFFSGGIPTPGNFTGGGGGSDLNGGGNGSVLTGGNGGTGTSGSQGSGGAVGQNGGSGSGSSGGGGGGDNGNGGNGGALLGGFGGGTSGLTNGGGGGGGVGGGGGGQNANGGKGGFGGGGGAAGLSFDADFGGSFFGGAGGDGGFGGGGGRGGLAGGNGGFGGGGGASTTFSGPSSGGFAGGSGGTGAPNMSGAGAALGGTIFISKGSSLKITDLLNISGSSIAAGTGGVQAPFAQALGQDIFIMSSGTMEFAHSNSLSITSIIDTDNGAGGGSTTIGGVIMSGSGILALQAANTYTGRTKCNGGTIQVSNDNNLGASSNPLDFNGGALEITTTGFSTSRSVTLNSSGGTINTDTNVIATFNTNIASSGSLTKTGNGTLVLKTNSYLGATNFNGGIVQISAPDNLGAGNLTFDGGTLELLTSFMTNTLSQNTTMNGGGGVFLTDTNVTATLSGTISGTGSLTKAGPGILILNGSNSYSGTLFNQGIVQISSPNNLGGNLVFNGGTVELLSSFSTNTISSLVALNPGGGVVQTDSSVVAILSGAISGNGSLTKEGLGTLILTGANNYLGGTTVEHGTLQGNTLGLQGTITLNNNSPLIFDQTTTGTFGGSIGGNGTVAKQNSGTVIVTGTNTYIGNTTVQAGTLTVNGVISPSMITVDSGATLAGNGVVADVIVNGTLSPGQSIGTLSGANFTLNPGSNYLVEFDNTTADLVASSQTVTINPGADLTIESLGANNPQVVYYTVITAAGGVIENSPFNLINNSPYQFVALYNPTEVLLVPLNPPNHFSGSGNAAGVADAYNQLISQHVPDDLIDITLILLFQTQAQNQESFLQMQPANFNGIALSQGNIAERIRQNFTWHLLNQNLSFCSDTKCHPQKNKNCNKAFWKNRSSSSMTTCKEIRHWHLWATPFLQHSHQNHRKRLKGYKDLSQGVTVGGDYQFEKQWILSAGFSYAHSSLDIIRGHAQATYETYAGTVASLWAHDSFFADASLSYLYSPAKVHRSMKFSASTPHFSSTARRKASFHQQSHEILGHFGGGYDFKINADPQRPLHLYPLVGIDYLYMRQAGYREHGAQSLDLKVYGKQYDMLRCEGGLGFGYTHCLSPFNFFLNLSAVYAGEFRFLGQKTKARFNAGAKNFTVKGLKPQNNLFCPAVALGIIPRDGKMNLTFFYQGELGAGFVQNAGEIELKINF